MKKKIFQFAFLLLATPSVFSQEIVPFAKPLPKISKSGKVTLTDGKSLKINGFNDKDATVFIVVRHSEKDTTGGTNADLNAIGRGRALTFPTIFEKIKFNGIYSTDKPRTRNTAAPIANVKRLKTEIYDTKKQADLLKDLVGKHGNKFFIVGHSNTVPQILNILRGDETEKEFSELDYSRLYIVVAKKLGEAQVWLINF